MAFDLREFRLAIVKSLLDGAVDNFKENVRTNGVLEDKAQKVAGVAGVFLAAALAFIKTDNLSVWPFNRLRVLVTLAIAVIAVICCIGLCLAVIWVRSTPGPVSVEALTELQSDLWALSEADLETREEGYWEDRVELWKHILDDQDTLLKSKSGRLFKAQLALATAMLTIALLLMLVIQPLIWKHL